MDIQKLKTNARISYKLIETSFTDKLKELFLIRFKPLYLPILYIVAGLFIGWGVGSLNGLKRIKEIKVLERKLEDYQSLRDSVYYINIIRSKTQEIENKQKEINDLHTQKVLDSLANQSTLERIRAINKYIKKR